MGRKSLECVKMDCFGNELDQRRGGRKCKILTQALGTLGEGCPFYKTKMQLVKERKEADDRLLRLTGLTARDYVKAVNAYTESDGGRYLDE